MFDLIIIICGILVGFMIGRGTGRSNSYNKNIIEIEKKTDDNRRFRNNFQIAYKWLFLEKNGQRLSNFFIKKPDQRIAVYGYGQIGKLLEKELDNCNINIEYFIDRNADNIVCNCPIYKLSDELPEIDVIIVTTSNFSEVKRTFDLTNNNCVVISMIDILNLLIDEI